MMWRNSACYKKIISTVSTTVFVFLVLCLSPNVFALGVGGIKLNSTLDQPLDANIELLGVSTEEVSEIEIKLASNAIYERMGIERTSLINQLNFAVREQDDGKYVIHINTDKSVTEPFLNFLIEVNWRNGRLLREFTVLLDPPVLTEEEPAPVSTPEAELPPSFSVTTETEVESEDTLFPMLESPELAAAETEESIENRLNAIEQEQASQTASTPDLSSDMSPDFSSVVSGQTSMARTVQSGEYLWKIANEMRPQNVTVEQMMLALQRENPSAFFGETISQLKAGAVLRISDSTSLNDISVAEAMAEVARQNQEWLAYKRERQARNAIAADSADAVPMGSESQPETVAALDSNRNLLELVSPIDERSQSDTSNATQEAATDAKINDLNVELTVANEAMEASKRENEELQGRMSALQNQMSAMQNLIQLKDDELQTIGADKQAGQDAEQLMPSLEVDINKEADISATMSPAEEIEESPTDTSISALLDDPITLATIAGSGLLLALLGWVLIRRKNKSSDDDAAYLNREAALDELFPETEGQSHETQVIKYNEALSEKELTEPDSEISLEPMTDISFEKNENELLESKEALLDPLAEADVYLTYEKYDKAETLLNKSIDAEPDRQELKLKLMEVYVLSSNMDGFNNMADILFAAIGGDENNPIWQHAESLAKDIGSLSPLFHLFDDGDNVSNDFLADDEDDLFKDTFKSEAQDTQQAEIELPSDIQLTNPTAAEESAISFSSPEEFATPEAASSTQTQIPPETLDEIDIDFDALVDERPTIIEEKSEDATVLDDSWKNMELPPQKLDTKTQPAESLFETTKPLDAQEIKTLDVESQFLDATTVINEEIISDDQLKELSDEFTEDKLVAKADFNEVDETEVTVDDVFESNESPVKSESIVQTSDEGTGFSETSLFLLSDEVGTKLDLAKAYMEMGDHEGAKDLLAEVIGEGNSQQKSEAKELLESA